MTPPAKTHPIMIIAALSVILFSIAGTAALMGWLPASRSEPAPAATLSDAVAAGENKDKAPEPHRSKPKPAKVAANVTADKEATPAKQSCPNCGVVESVKIVELEGQGSGLGAVAGGVVGGLLGNQIGQGRGNTVATVAGVAGGAYAGHQVEKHIKKTRRFDIVVRMEDGSERTFHQDTDPGFASGQKVRIDGNAIIPR
jgi:outer membrane lipoprotein SlyB